MDPADIFDATREAEDTAINSPRESTATNTSRKSALAIRRPRNRVGRNLQQGMS
jgi:hypothetical protein